MEKLFLILFAISGLLFGCNGSDEEPIPPRDTDVSLFNKEAKAVVYMDYLDNNLTIYMWDGTPVAYVDNKEDIYLFNGHFFGWYANGIVYDKEGYAVFAREGVVRGEIKMDNPSTESTAKGAKKDKPAPKEKSSKPDTPKLKDEWKVIVPPFDELFQIEVTLYDQGRDAIAYIDYGDNMTIYMWDGTPVAYLEENEGVYRFDGRFLGWYEDGIVYDKEGYAVAAREGTLKGEISMVTPLPASPEEEKKGKPDKGVKESKPVLPQFENSWSKTSLTDFFLSE